MYWPDVSFHVSLTLEIVSLYHVLSSVYAHGSRACNDQRNMCAPTDYRGWALLLRHYILGCVSMLDVQMLALAKSRDKRNIQAHRLDPG